MDAIEAGDAEKSRFQNATPAFVPGLRPKVCASSMRSFSTLDVNEQSVNVNVLVWRSKPLHCRKIEGS